MTARMNFNIVGYLIYSSVMAITPGPNNLMLFSYGKAYGLNESQKVMLGIFLGVYVMLFLAGYGIAGIINNNPVVELILKIVGSLWMLYLAFILRKISIDMDPNKKIVIGFGQAFLQQFVNIKAWIMAVNGAVIFMPKTSSIHLSIFIFATAFVIVGIPAMIIWLKMGDLIAKIIKSERSNRILGYIMFSSMVLTIVLIWI
jgi:threonine/homoserine/homoserine lactone efflux protein